MLHSPSRQWVPRIFVRCSTSATSEMARTVPFLEYARSARQDVADLIQQLEGSPCERLHGLSSMALELWPKESPHWRLAGEIVPLEIEARKLQEEMKEKEKGQDTKDGISDAARAEMLRVLCGIRSRPSLRLAELLLVGKGLAFKVNLEELSKCVCAVAEASWHPLSKDSAVSLFATEGMLRLDEGAKLLATEQLLTLHRSAQRLGLKSPGIRTELRRRVLHASEVKHKPETSQISTASVEGPGVLVAAAQVLNETAVLRSSKLREALLFGTCPGVEVAGESELVGLNYWELLAGHKQRWIRWIPLREIRLIASSN
eukprot:symbB.v1.2.027757.t1/scaffold2735.1/size73862/5